MKRPRGAGGIYKRSNSANLWISYYRNGVQVREPSGSDSYRQAQKLLQQRQGEIAVGKYIEPSSRKVTIDQLYESLLTNYKINKLASYDSTEARWQRQPLLGEEMPEAGRLKRKFSGMLAIALTTPKIEQYVKWCQEEERLENATINRDLAALRRAFKLGMKAGIISKCPDFPKLKESAPREGFLDYADHEKLKAHAHELWLRAILACAFLGMRKSEIVGNWRRKFVDGLKVRQIDLLARQIRLGITKNGDRRLVPMTQEAYTLLSACCAGKNPNDWVFTHADGSQVMDFRKRFARLKREAGVRPDLLLHDNRRSMARNLRRAGVDQKTIMLMGGWKTDSVFQRYDIHDEADLADAARKYDAAKENWGAEQAQFKHSSEKSTPSKEKPAQLN